MKRYIQVLKDRRKLFKRIFQQRNRNLLSLMIEIFKLYFTRDFKLKEIHDYELDRKGSDYVRSFLNATEQRKYLYLLNPRRYYTLARNKFLTHIYLDNIGIKNKAKLLCYYNPEMRVNSNLIATNIKEAREILHNCGEKEFIIKTTESSHGDNVWVIKGVEYTEYDVKLVRYDGKIVFLSSLLKEEALIFETLIRQSNQMNAFNSSSVNTIRIMTTLYPNGQAKTIAAFMKIGREGSCVDNAGNGGNVDAAVDVTTGRLYNTIEFNGWRNTRSITHHPDSHEKVEGIAIENWLDIRRKVEEFQKVFPFVKAAGWDIALTDDGPYIVEVNDMWDRTGQLFIGHGWKKEIEDCYEAWTAYYTSHSCSNNR